ncbi:hypothetical protein KPSA1_04405 [Pseudomonas syringae pv. actinidiae]|uniref:Uncharacterized protein n=1 Tax=Pseudomonas syringae pv. actinidiae TaxID=103796 RepID=A0A2V0QCZ0_PSESF|nr:hypothetical protein KPSA1_04405 [Pseudomonas syringae pv. actinidiae]
MIYYHRQSTPLSVGPQLDSSPIVPTIKNIPT